MLFLVLTSSQASILSQVRSRYLGMAVELHSKISN
jgi:hypothetical protein